MNGFRIDSIIFVKEFEQTKQEKRPMIEPMCNSKHLMSMFITFRVEHIISSLKTQKLH